MAVADHYRRPPRARHPAACRSDSTGPARRGTEPDSQQDLRRHRHRDAGAGAWSSHGGVQRDQRSGARPDSRSRHQSARLRLVGESRTQSARVPLVGAEFPGSPRAPARVRGVDGFHRDQRHLWRRDATTGDRRVGERRRLPDARRIARQRPRVRGSRSRGRRHPGRDSCRRLRAAAFWGTQSDWTDRPGRWPRHDCHRRAAGGPEISVDADQFLAAADHQPRDQFEGRQLPLRHRSAGARHEPVRCPPMDETGRRRPGEGVSDGQQRLGGVRTGQRPDDALGTARHQRPGPRRDQHPHPGVHEHREPAGGPNRRATSGALGAHRARRERIASASAAFCRARPAFRRRGCGRHGGGRRSAATCSSSRA